MANEISIHKQQAGSLKLGESPFYVSINTLVAIADKSQSLRLNSGEISIGIVINAGTHSEVTSSLIKALSSMLNLPFIQASNVLHQLVRSSS